MIEQNHKGEWCGVRKHLLCQEGYCSDCEIYVQKKRIKVTEIYTVDEEIVKKNVN